jgi:hypothetical protein
MIVVVQMRSLEWADLRASFGGGCSEFSEVVGCGWRVFRDLGFF